MNALLAVLTTIALETSLGANKLSLPNMAGQMMSQMLYAKYADEYDKVIMEVMTSFKDIMKNGSEQYGIPVLDPLVIDKKFNINNQQLQLQGEFQAEIHNLSNFIIEKIHADMNLNSYVNITLNDVSMKGHYSLNGLSMNLIPIVGAGQHSSSFKTLNLAIGPEFEVKDGYLKMFHSGLGFHENDLEVFVEGLLEDSDLSKLLAYFLRDLLSSIFSRNTQLAKVLNNKVIQSFNGDDGKGKDIYDLIETVKALAGS